MSSPRAAGDSPVPSHRAVFAAAVAEQKRTARAGVRATRRTRAALPAGDPRRAHEAAAIAAAILPRVPAGAGTVVASYVALPTEPPTDLLHAQLAARGVRTIVPILLPDKDLDWMALEAAAPDGRPLSQDQIGQDAIGQDAIGRAALIVVPALLVDRAGRRLGQGGGSYDRALARRDPAAIVVAVVDDDGLVDVVPHEAHDAVVDAVVRPAHGWVTLPPR